MVLQIRRSIEFLGTEIFSPFILAGCLLLAVPIMFTPDWGWQAAVGLLSVVAIPWGLSLWMSHTGRTTDKFIYHRRQRYGFYGISLLSMAAGAITLLVTPSALEVKAIIVTLLAAVAAITVVNFRLKASAHACMSAIFAVVIPGVLGLWWAVATFAVHAVVCWSRWTMKKHTILELVVGTLLGAGAGALYLLYI